MRIKSKNVMSWNSRKKKESIFCKVYFVSKKLINICVLSQFIVYWIHIKKHFFIHFYWLFLILSKAFSVSLKWKEPHNSNFMFAVFIHGFNLKAQLQLKSTLWSEAIFGSWKLFKKMMKNASYFTSKALFVPKIFKFLSFIFWLCKKRLDKKDKVNFKFHDVTAQWTNIVQYLEK